MPENLPPPGTATLVGIRPRNPLPVDTWSGPYTGDTFVNARQKALDTIPTSIRFNSMQVRLIEGEKLSGTPKIYWFSGGTADENLVEFVPDIPLVGTYFYQDTPPEPGATGLTVGSKWFNTVIGAEFTYLPDPPDGADIWVMTNVFAGPQGSVGAQGQQGVQGSTGDRGEDGRSVRFLGSTNDSSITSGANSQDVNDALNFLATDFLVERNSGAVLEEGDGIINLFDGELWIVVRVDQENPYVGGGVSGDWRDIGSIVGPQGFQGDVGADGRGILQFTGPVIDPNDPKPISDLYLQLAVTGGLTGTLLIETVGPTQPPLPQIGDYFVDTVKTEGIYYCYFADDDINRYLFALLQGKDGEKGATGSQGATGADGADGDQGNQGFQGITGPDFVFTEDITASFGQNKSFGKYGPGERIPAQNKTIQEVLLDALNESLPITLGLTYSYNGTESQTLLFGDPAPQINYSWNYSVNSLGAGLSSGDIVAVVNGITQSPPLLTLSSSSEGISSGTGATTLNLSYINTSGNNINFVFTARDDREDGVTNSFTRNIPQHSYGAPGISFTQSRFENSPISGETVTNRERGNTRTWLHGVGNTGNDITLTRNLNNHDSYKFEQYSIQRRDNNVGDWIEVDGLTAQQDFYNINSFNNNAPTTVNQTQYRLLYRDTFYTASLQNRLTLGAIEFRSPIFFGGTSDNTYLNPPATGQAIRDFVVGETRQNGAIFIPTSTPRRFIIEEFAGDSMLFVALPTTMTMIEAENLDNALAGSYFSPENPFGFQFTDGITTVPLSQSTERDYNVYVLSAALGAAPANGVSDRIEITITGSPSPQ